MFEFSANIILLEPVAGGGGGGGGGLSWGSDQWGETNLGIF